MLGAKTACFSGCPLLRVVNICDKALLQLCPVALQDACFAIIPDVVHNTSTVPWHMSCYLALWHDSCHNTVVMTHHNTWCHATSYAIACHAICYVTWGVPCHMSCQNTWCYTVTHVVSHYLMLCHDTWCCAITCYDITWCYAMTHSVRCWHTNWCSALRETWLKTKLCMKRLNILTHSKWNCKIDTCALLYILSD